jgi:hypothetical protein
MDNQNDKITQNGVSYIALGSPIPFKDAHTLDML